MAGLASRLILASGSPRRLDILRAAGLEPEVCVPEVDEDALLSNWSKTDVGVLASSLALAKAEGVLQIYKNQAAMILAADTIVYKNRILGKPKDEAEALKMLLLLRNTRHEVFTGAVLLDARDGTLLWQVAERTEVCFGDYPRQAALDYIRSVQPYDKAGSYAIQGGWRSNVTEIIGDFDNVVGLPSSVVQRLLALSGA